MLGNRLVIVSDAHLGTVPTESDDRFLAFLDQVPDLGDALLINGDLFDFWFSYRRVIPRAGFRAAASLAVLARRMPVMMTGGNHDRWGNTFWQQDAGVRYEPSEIRFRAMGLDILALHGDGIAEEHRSARIMHRITRHPLTSWAYRLIHPDLGIGLVDRMSTRLADSTRDAAVLERASVRQAAWAEARLAADPSIGLLVMSHTHRPALAEPFPGRRYLNPGAWIDGRHFAIVTPEAVQQRQFDA